MMARKRQEKISRFTADLTPELHEMLEQLAEAYHTTSQVEVVRILIRRAVAFQKLPLELRSTIAAHLVAQEN